MPKKSASYDEFLFEQLRDNPDFTKEYLNEALHEDDPAAFYLAVKNVIQAGAGMAQTAQDADLNRESLYKALSGKRSPEWATMRKVLHALGFELAVS